jgi:hypothetical protein
MKNRKWEAGSRKSGYRRELFDGLYAHPEIPFAVSV